MSAQSREHPPGWVKHTPKHLGSLMFVFWLKLHVPFGCGLSQNAPASIKFTGERAAQLCLCPASTHTTSSLCGKHSPPLTDRKTQTHRHKSPLDFSQLITRGLCAVPHLPRAPPQESQQHPQQSQQCWLHTELRLGFQQPPVLSFQNMGFCDVPIFNQSQVQRKLACLEVGMCEKQGHGLGKVNTQGYN